MSAAASSVESTPPAEPIPLPGSGEWSVWPWVRIRGAGFPVGLVDALAMPETAHALDSSHPEAGAVFARESERVADALLAIARMPLFREAIAWQNRGALRDGVDALLRHPERRDRKTSARQRIVAKYLQRYCTKNDTIGFFGPVGWGRIRDRGPALEMAPGPSLIRERHLFFEFWAVDAVAESLAADPEIRPFAPPRRAPALLDDASLTAVERRLLERCGGERSARALARELVSAGDYPDERSVVSTLERLAERGALFWSFELPPFHYGTRPEQVLRRKLEAIEDEAVRARALGTLDELERARDEVRGAEGDTSLLTALDSADATFSRLTGRASSRLAGKTYAGRTVLYQDCVRDLDLHIGPAVLERLGPPLGLFLQGLRWFSHALASRYREVLTAAYRTLAARTGETAVPLPALENEVLHEFPLGRQASAVPIVARTIEDLNARWRTILAVPVGARRVERTTEELAPAVRTAFAADRPGWPNARFLSPDLMIAARDADGIRRGDYQAVLGELHIGNTLTTRVSLSMHPAPEELVRRRERDLAPTLSDVPSKDLPGTRTKSFSPSPQDYDVEMANGRSWREPSHVLRAADMLVEERGGAVVVYPRDGGVSFDVVEAFQVLMSLAQPGAVTLDGAHTPRVVVGGLVVARETWRLERDECAFAIVADPFERFAQSRSWARAHGMPRYLFAQTPDETKPWFVDLDSAVYVDVLAAAVRKASRVRFSEMLPGPDQSWLTDAEGRAYTCELRMACVDPHPWRRPP